ncbi:hypothetical protein GCM10023196_035580 [Actinoallomurus vinaceus]|uniref:DUF3168 domain-containing protein n=1 Tax=Actinoallomurus vinaceus TaxID=1080074 RepID=A0ABP8UC54_9ACTN
MPGTNVVAAKKALLAIVADTPALRGVQALYQWTGEAEREVIFCGKARFERENADMAADPAETLTIDLHVGVAFPGGSAEEAETRAVQIGALIEAALTADPRLGERVPGLLFAEIASGEADVVPYDEEVRAEIVYQVSLLSHLR